LTDLISLLLDTISTGHRKRKVLTNHWEAAGDLY
jgi:hypothetical protein